MDEKIRQKLYRKSRISSIFEQVKELKEFQEAKTIFCYASMKMKLIHGS